MIMNMIILKPSPRSLKLSSRWDGPTKGEKGHTDRDAPSDKGPGMPRGTVSEDALESTSECSADSKQRHDTIDSLHPSWSITQAPDRVRS